MLQLSSRDLEEGGVSVKCWITRSYRCEVIIFGSTLRIHLKSLTWKNLGIIWNG